MLKIVRDLLGRGVRPDKIAFVTFTRKGAEEAKTRAAAEFQFSADDLRWFRTIHSLVFKQLGLNKARVVGREDLAELGRRLGLPFDGLNTIGEDGEVSGMATGDVLVFLENLGRVTEKGNARIWAEYDHGVGHDARRGVTDLGQLEMFGCAYDKFKAQRGKLDYTDMLEQFIAGGRAPAIEHLIVDEAQDLSRLQWRVVEILAAVCESVYVAGDEDQACFKWAGADVETFVQLDADVEVLDQSYRIPASVHQLAVSLTSRIKLRREKIFKPRSSPGRVDVLHDHSEIDMSQGSWLLLARHVYQLSAYERHCKQNGWPYEIKGRSPVNSPDVRAIMMWEKLRRGEQVHMGEALLCLKRIGRVEAAGRSKLAALDPSGLVTMGELKTRFGLKTDEIWHKAMTKIPVDDVEFFLAARRRGERLTAQPRIKISTIHGAKGGQADHVVLGTDVSEMVFNTMNRSADDETRVFYVGATRAIETLTVVAPRTPLYFDMEIA